jgi:aminopeptidase N
MKLEIGVQHRKLNNKAMTLVLAAQILFSTSTPSNAQVAFEDELAIDVEHVALDLKFDLETASATGSARIFLSPKKATSLINLDAQGLAIKSVTLAGEKNLKFSYNEASKGGNLVVKLDRRYETTEELDLQIVYSTVHTNETDPANIWGSYGRGLRFHLSSNTDQRRRPQMWSSSLPGSNRYWFPSNDRPNDLRTFEIRATVDGGLKVLSNGRLVSERTNADGSRTVHWKTESPHQNHRSSIVIGDFENFSTQSNGIKLNNYGYPDEMDGVEASVERLPDMLSFLESTIGTTFPYPAYTQVFVQEFPWGLANAGLATLTENFVDSKEVHRDFLYLWDDLEAESLAEHWFGNSVGVEKWEDLWLSRGLPRYLATLYNESRLGEAELLLSSYHVPSDLLTIKNDWKNDVRSAVRPEKVEDPAAFTTGNASTIRGTIFLRALESEIGRDKLLEAIRDFAVSKAGKLATTEDFEQTVSRVSGRELKWFFDQGLERSDYPNFTASHQYDPISDMLSVQIDQEPLDPESISTNTGKPFRGSMEIEVDGTIVEVELLPIARNTFQIASDRAPRFVNFDYKSRWLAEWKYEQTAQQLFDTVSYSADMLAKRNALVSLGTVALDEATNEDKRLKITELYSRLIESDEYWRLKMVAMFQLRRVMNGNGVKEKAGLNSEIEAALVRIVQGKARDEAWVRFAALNWLGEARDPNYADMYMSLLRDPSDRVINAAAIALGKSNDPRAFDALVKLEPHPSWKNQSRISMLNGLAEVGDARAVSIATRALKDRDGARWTLLTPVWDYRLAAAHTLRRLDGITEGVSFLNDMFDRALGEDHISDCMYNIHLMVALAAPEARDAITKMRDRYSTKQSVLNALDPIEKQLEASLK